MANVQLGSKAVGSIVKLKVNGTATEFIIVHQGKPSSIYDESCNGTWLLMKDIYENRQWHTTNNREYQYSAIHNYLNGAFLNLFDENISGSIKQVKIPYLDTPALLGTVAIKSGANGLPCKIFPLSGYEVGWTESDDNFWADGAKLDYFAAGTGTSANSNRIAKLNGSAANWWLRSPYTANKDTAWCVSQNGSYSNYTVTTMCGIRPALVLPQDMEVDSSGNVTMPIGTHKTLINGTAYTVKGGKCLVNGTVYDIKKGRTLIGGTGYDITFAPPLVMPVKGDLITMNLDGTNRLYRVLKIVDKTVVEVLTMWNLGGELQFDKAYDDYKNSELDTYLNTTWYNTLSSTAKAALVSKNINQYAYTGNSVYNPNTHASYANYSTKTLNENVGNRYIYALDVEDIEMYFGGTGGSANDKTPATFSETDILQMFWNQTTTTRKFVWLRSKKYDDYGYGWNVKGKGFVDISNVRAFANARGALQIDLSKIGFTIN